MSIIKDFDEFRKHLKDENAKKLAINFRKKLKKSELNSDRYALFFMYIMDGLPVEETARDLGLI